MNYSEYRSKFKTVEEFRRAFGKLTEDEARALAAADPAPTFIKACMMTTWHLCRQEAAEREHPLSAEGISALMQNDVPVFYAESVDSTSSWARRSGERYALFAAASQTGGRGRLGRAFASPSGGAYLSFVFDPRRPPENALTVTAAASVAVLRAVGRVSGVRLGIKWVNDLYLDGKKVCGILTEAADGVIIIGVGVNLQTADLPDGLKSIARGLDAPVSRAELIAAIADGLCGITRDLDGRSWLDEYRERSVLTGKDIVFYENGTPQPARVIGIDDNCALAVRLPDGGEKTLSSGEITVRL